MKNLIKIIIPLFILCFYSCKNEAIKIDEVRLEKISEINQLTDSSFISDIRSICYYNETFYLTDYKRNQIILLNNELKLLSFLGSRGKGPGEFLGAAHLYIDNDSIYVLNDGKKTIEVFGKNSHIKTITPPTSTRVSSRHRFVKFKNNFYVSSTGNDKSILRFNSQNKIKRFGLVKKYGSAKETNIKNKKQLVKYKKYIIGISDNRPKIEMYDIEGNIISEFNYGYIKILEQTIDYIRNKQKRMNSYLMIVSDAYIYSNKLYLLLRIRSNEKMTSNKILEIEIDETKFKPTRVLDLGLGWFNTFCISDNNQLIASNGNLIKFRIND